MFSLFKKKASPVWKASHAPTPGCFYVFDKVKGTILSSFNDKPSADEFARTQVETIDDRFQVLHLVGETRFVIQV